MDKPPKNRTAVSTLTSNTFSMMGFMFIASMVLMMFGLVTMVSMLFFRVTFLYLIYAGLSALLFMVYLAIDIQVRPGNGGAKETKVHSSSLRCFLESLHFLTSRCISKMHYIF